MGKQETVLYDKIVVGKVSKIDIMNMSNASTPYKDATEWEAKRLVGFVIDQKNDTENGGLVNVSYIVFEDGTIVGGVSSTACETLHENTDSIADMLADGEPLKAQFKLSKSKSEREFVQIIFS